MGWLTRFGREIKLFAALIVLAIGMLVGAGLLAFLAAGEIYDYQDSVDGVHLPQVDAVVCLAGGRGRIAAAGDVWYRYWEMARGPVGKGEVPVLYLSGMGQKSGFGVLKNQVRRGVRDVLKPEQVILETESTNTEENALYFARYAQKKGWKRVLLMTSRYHMLRSRLIFARTLQRMGLQIQVETLSVYQEPFEPGEWRSGLHGIRVTMLEYFKWVWYRAAWNPPGIP